jgi:hypothetical protein
MLLTKLNINNIWQRWIFLLYKALLKNGLMIHTHTHKQELKYPIQERKECLNSSIWWMLTSWWWASREREEREGRVRVPISPSKVHLHWSNFLQVGCAFERIHYLLIAPWIGVQAFNTWTLGDTYLNHSRSKLSNSIQDSSHFY